MKVLLLLFFTLWTTVLASSLFEFKPNETTWFPRNDGVMGGISSSRVQLRNGILVFSGRVRLENGGGFAGFRSVAGQYNLRQFSGIRLRVRGDGKRYSFQVVTRRTMYQTGFKTKPGTWLEVSIPFNTMQATLRGEPIRAAKLDPSNIRSFGLIVGNGRAENFKLELDWIRVQ
jgi:NADH dehydrogenase [ubiquinone] 1 alpha subcomplex assembly factor 1